MFDLSNMRDAWQLFMKTPGFQESIAKHKAAIGRQRRDVLAQLRKAAAEQEVAQASARKKADGIWEKYRKLDAERRTVLQAGQAAELECARAEGVMYGARGSAYRQLQALADPRIAQYRDYVHGLWNSVRHGSQGSDMPTTTKVAEDLRAIVCELDELGQTDYGDDAAVPLKAIHQRVLEAVSPVSEVVREVVELPRELAL